MKVLKKLDTFGKKTKMNMYLHKIKKITSLYVLNCSIKKNY